MDEMVIPLWKDLIRTGRWRRGERFERALDQHRAAAAGAGRLNTGFYLNEIAERSAAELSERGEEWSTYCVQVLTAGKVWLNQVNRRELAFVFGTEVLSDHQLLFAQQEKLASHLRAGTFGAGLEIAKGIAESAFGNHLGLLELSQKASALPLVELLRAPRYEAIRLRWTSALAQVDTVPQDAIRDAVTALEAAARLLTGRRGASLGDALKELRKSSRYSQLLVDAIEKVWGYANATPDARHGSPVAADVTFAEAKFCVDTTFAALRWMLSMDRVM